VLELIELFLPALSVLKSKQGGRNESKNLPASLSTESGNVLLGVKKV
jgi:hypothetical protein